MKKIFIISTMIFPIILSFLGCTKSGSEITTEIQDTHAKYIGTWKGLVSDTLKTTSDTITISIFRKTVSSPLQGYVRYRQLVYRITESVFFGGISFSVINYDPQCQSYQLTLNTVLTDTAHILINFWGQQCNSTSIATSGIIPKKSPHADLSNILTFGQNGNSWTWRVTNYDNSTCTYTNTLQKDYQNGVYVYAQSNLCGWQYTSPIAWWYVTPQEWGNLTDTLVQNRFTYFRTDAVVGTVYKKRIAQDSVVNTVELLDDPVVIGNQTYQCAKIHTQQWHSGTYILNGNTWINYQYGFVKFENLITFGALASVHYEELISKNF